MNPEERDILILKRINSYMTTILSKKHAIGIIGDISSIREQMAFSKALKELSVLSDLYFVSFSVMPPVFNVFVDNRRWISLDKVIRVNDKEGGYIFDDYLHFGILKDILLRFCIGYVLSKFGQINDFSILTGILAKDEGAGKHYPISILCLENKVFEYIKSLALISEGIFLFSRKDYKDFIELIKKIIIP